MGSGRSGGFGPLWWPSLITERLLRCRVTCLLLSPSNEVACAQVSGRRGGVVTVRCEPKGLSLTLLGKLC